MIALAIAVVLGQLLASLGLFLGLRWYVEREKRALAERVTAVIREWISADGDKPSRFAALVDVAGETVGRAAARALLERIGTSNSQASKLANGVIAEAQPENPIMALLAGGMPKGKGAGMMRLAQLLAPMLAGMGGNKPGENTPSVRERLGRNGG